MCPNRLAAIGALIILTSRIHGGAVQATYLLGSDGRAVVGVRVDRQFLRAR